MSSQPDGLSPVVGTGPPGAVHLDVPADVRSLRLLRLTAAGIASDAGFDLDAVEAARIAVDELASVLLSAGEWERLRCSFDVIDGALSAEGRAAGGAGGSTNGDEPIEVDAIVRELLAVCARDWEVSTSDTGPLFRFSISPAGV